MTITNVTERLNRMLTRHFTHGVTQYFFMTSVSVDSSPFGKSVGVTSAARFVLMVRVRRITSDTVRRFLLNIKTGLNGQGVRVSTILYAGLARRFQVMV